MANQVTKNTGPAGEVEATFTPDPTYRGVVTIQVSAGAIATPFNFRVTVTGDTLSTVSNASPSVMSGNVTELRVKLVDSTGANIVGRTVNFAVTTGEDNLSAASAVTDAQGEAIVSYTGGAAGPATIQATGTDLNIVTFNVTVSAAAPTLSTATVENGAPTNIVLTFNEALSTTAPATSAFTVAGKTVSGVAIAGAVTTVTVDSGFVDTDTITISYTVPGTNPLQSTGGTQVAAFTDQAVTNNVQAAAAAPTLSTATVENAAPSDIVLTFSEALNTTAPATSAFTVAGKTVSGVGIAGTVVTVTVDSDFADTDTITISYAVPGTNPLQSTGGSQVVAFSNQAVVNNVQAVAAAPTISTVTVENAAPANIVLTFNEALSTTAPAASAFTVAGKTVSGVVIAGSVVTVTVGTPFVSTDAITISYAVPGTNPLQSTGGTQVAALTNQVVVNNVQAVVTAPTISTATVENATPANIVLTFSEALNTTAPATSAFTVTGKTVSGVAIAGSAVTVTVGTPFVSTDAITISYAVPGINPLQSTGGTQVIAFTNQAVVNNVQASVALNFTAWDSVINQTDIESSVATAAAGEVFTEQDVVDELAKVVWFDFKSPDNLRTSADAVPADTEAINTIKSTTLAVTATASGTGAVKQAGYAAFDSANSTYSFQNSTATAMTFIAIVRNASTPADANEYLFDFYNDDSGLAQGSKIRKAVGFSSSQAAAGGTGFDNRMVFFDSTKWRAFNELLDDSLHIYGWTHSGTNGTYRLDGREVGAVSSIDPLVDAANKDVYIGGLQGTTPLGVNADILGMIYAPEPVDLAKLEPFLQSYYATPVISDPTEDVSLQSLLQEIIDRTAIARFPEHNYTLRLASSYDRRKDNINTPINFTATDINTTNNTITFTADNALRAADRVSVGGTGTIPTALQPANNPYLYVIKTNAANTREISLANSIASAVGVDTTVPGTPDKLDLSGAVGNLTLIPSFESSNWDWSAFIRTEGTGVDTEYVMMDVTGPGALVRVWWAIISGNPDPVVAQDLSAVTNTINIYIDGATEPTISGLPQDLFGGSTLTGPPLSDAVGNSHKSQTIENYLSRGRILYLPIPYANSLKMTIADPNGDIDDPSTGVPGSKLRFYYNLEYREYEAGTTVQSYDPTNKKYFFSDLRSANTTLAAKTDSGVPATTNQNITTGAIAANGEISLTPNLTGPSSIRKLTFKISAADLSQALRSTILEITFDGAASPQVQVPIGEFFGTGYIISEHETWTTKVIADGTMTSTWVMPFQTSAAVKIRNLGAQSVTLDVGTVETAPWTWDAATSMHFNSNWIYFQSPVEENAIRRLISSSREKLNWNTITGKGRYVGGSLAIYNGGTRWWGEGDELYRTDSTNDTDFQVGSGTEDWANYSHGSKEPFSFFHASQPRGVGNGALDSLLTGDVAAPGLTTNNRVRLLDAAPFNTSFDFDMELLHWEDEKNLDYTVATFWYGIPGATSDVVFNETHARYKVPQSLADINVAATVVGAPVATAARIEGETLSTDPPGVAPTAPTTIIQNPLTDTALDGIGVPSTHYLSGENFGKWEATAIGQSVTFKFNAPSAGDYNVVLRLPRFSDYGKHRILLNGVEVIAEFSSYIAAADPDNVWSGGAYANATQDLGTRTLTATDNLLRVDSLDPSPSAGFSFGIDYIDLTPI